MRRLFLASVLLLQLIGTVFILIARVDECGEQFATCMQHRAALNITTAATLFLIFWTFVFGMSGRIGGLVLSGIFLVAILLADVLFLADGLTGSNIYSYANLENAVGVRTVAKNYLFTTSYFTYNIWLLACIGLIAAALYFTVTEFRSRKLEYT